MTYGYQSIIIWSQTFCVVGVLRGRIFPISPPRPTILSFKYNTALFSQIYTNSYSFTVIKITVWLDGRGAMTILYLRVSTLHLVLCNPSWYSAEEHHENLQELHVTKINYLKYVTY